MRSGPFKGVRNTNDPYDDTPDLLVDATNIYIPDPEGGSGAYARPGFTLQNSASPLATPGQAVYTHETLDGTVYNFLVAGGVLYRANAALAVFTNVTPVGAVIDAAATHVYFESFGDALIVSDGVHPPWIATNLSATPITGTYIDFDGSSTPWAAYGRPTVYAGSLFFILDNVNGVGARTDLVWSAPGAPDLGYQQPDYDFRWTLEQTGNAPIYAIWGTNVALYYWRELSISTIAGIPGPDLQQTHTADAIAVNIGTLQSATITQYGNTIFFCDQIGRPTMIPIGSAPVPIWLNMRSVVDSSTYGYPHTMQAVANAALQSVLNLYVAAIWSPVPAIANHPIEMHVFDAKTGLYVGRWIVAPGISISAMGFFQQAGGSGAFVLIGSKVQGANPADGFVWLQQVVVTGGLVLTTEAVVLMLTEGGLQITTEATPTSWKDNDVVPNIGVTTQRIGYSDDHIWNVDSCTAITTSNAPCNMIATTSTVATALEAIATPASSQDGTYRVVGGFDVQGRGTQVTVSPTTADSQWSCQSVSIIGIPSLATADEP